MRRWRWLAVVALIALGTWGCDATGSALGFGNDTTWDSASWNVSTWQ